MSKIRFGLIGSGWRAEFYIRIAKAIPEKFELTGVVIRNREKGEEFARKFGVNVVQSLDEPAQKPARLCGAIRQERFCYRLFNRLI